MANRVPPLTEVSPGVYRDENSKVNFRIVSVQNDVSCPIPIEGNTINTHAKRRIELYVNGMTTYGKEFNILTISLGIVYCRKQPNSTTEVPLDIPIISDGGDVEIPYKDIVDSLETILNFTNDAYAFDA